MWQPPRRTQTRPGNSRRGAARSTCTKNGHLRRPSGGGPTNSAQPPDGVAGTASTWPTSPR
eukprot:6412065-Lingulodinium_polyedra.AAC.1